MRWACLVHDLGKGTTPADVLPRHIGHEERSARLRALGATTVRSLPGVEEHVRFPLPMGLGDKSMAELSSSRS